VWAFYVTTSKCEEAEAQWTYESNRVSPSSAIFLVGTKTDMADEATLSAAEIEEQVGLLVNPAIVNVHYT